MRMSNDLISRSAVIDVIKRHECDMSRIMEGVMDLPIAYSTDKVVELLEDMKYVMIGNYGVRREVVNFDDSVEIVKSGGIE